MLARAEAEMARTEVTVMAPNRVLIDPTYQRTLRMGWVTQKANEFDFFAVGVIYVSKRVDAAGNVTYWVLDGQHRIRVHKEVGFGERLVHAYVISGLTAEEEAALFLRLNANHSVGPIDKLRARLAKREPFALQMQNEAALAGFYLPVGEDPANGRRPLTAVQAAEWVAKAGPGHLRTTLEIILRSWPRERTPASAEVLRCVGEFVHRYLPQIDVDYAIQRFATVQLVHVLQPGSGKEGAARHQANARELRETYNTHLRTNKLPAWSER
jgi:hypothetical protein